MKRLTAVLVVVAALAGCRHWQRETGDLKVNVPEARRVEILAAKSVVRILNRGAVPVEVSGAGRPFVLATSQDRELNLEGDHVLEFAVRGEGRGEIDLHYTVVGRNMRVSVILE